MKRKIVLFSAIFCLGLFIQSVTAQATLRNYNTTFRTNAQRDTAHWGWTPLVSFELNGPLSASAMATVDFTLPDGKPWFTADCPLDGREYKSVKVEDCGNKVESSKTSFATGSFGYTIKFVDELAGTNQFLQTGKIRIGKFLYNPAETVEGKNQFYYYLDNDWRLPIGFVYPYYDEGEATGLNIDMWFKGTEAEEDDFSGHLFYQGKEVGNTKGAGGTTSKYIVEKAIERNPYEYYQRSFTIFAQITCQYPDAHQHQGIKLKENPGNYELKVLFKGRLVRSVKFSIGSDGFPVDNGIAKNSNFGNPVIIVPVSVLGTLDGTWNKTAWQTEAFWGNPLKGFTAIQ